jgi:hypothetical protein
MRLTAKTQVTPSSSLREVRAFSAFSTYRQQTVTIVAAPVVAAVSAPAWIPALIGGLGSAGAMVSAAFGWKYLGR